MKTLYQFSLFILLLIPSMTYATSSDIKSLYFEGATPTTPEVIYTADRFDTLVDEANTLFGNGDTAGAQQKLDEYIDNVFFPRECNALELYVDILQQTGKTDAVKQYSDYIPICNNAASDTEIEAYLGTINDTGTFSDKNVFLWKSYLHAKHKGDFVPSQEYISSYNVMFTELIYLVQTLQTDTEISSGSLDRLLESDHLLTPSMIVLYLEHIKLYKGVESLSEAIEINQLSQIMERLLSFDDIYLRGFRTHNSSHEYAYRFLGDSTLDINDKLYYRLSALVYADSYKSKGKKSHNDIISTRKQKVFDIATDLIISENIQKLEILIPTIQKYINIDWEELLSIYNKELSIENINTILSILSPETDAVIQTQGIYYVLESYIQKSTITQDECDSLQEYLLEKNLSDVKVSCKIAVEEEINIQEDISQEEDNSSTKNVDSQGKNEGLNIGGTFSRENILIIASILIFILLVGFIVFIINKK